MKPARPDVFQPVLSALRVFFPSAHKQKSLRAATLFPRQGRGHGIHHSLWLSNTSAQLKVKAITGLSLPMWPPASPFSPLSTKVYFWYSPLTPLPSASPPSTVFLSGTLFFFATLWPSSPFLPPSTMPFYLTHVAQLISVFFFPSSKCSFWPRTDQCTTSLWTSLLLIMLSFVRPHCIDKLIECVSS